MALVAASSGTAACGSDDPTRGAPERPSPQSLSAAERTRAATGERAIRTYCRALGLHLAGRRGPPGPAVQRRALAGARAIAGIARARPTARYMPGQTARQLAGDTAEDLEGTNCSGRLVIELRRGL